MEKERPPPFLVVSIFANNAAIIYITYWCKNTTNKQDIKIYILAD